MKCLLVLMALSALSCESDSPLGPRIDGVEPQRVESGRETVATISGQNFRTQPYVDIDSPKAPTINRVFDVWLGTNALATAFVSYVDDATLTIVVPKTLAVGPYDLTVRTPAGRWAKLQDALVVYDPSSYASGGVTSNSGGGSATSHAGTSGALASFIGGGTFGGNGGSATFTVAGTTSIGSGGTAPASMGGITSIGSGGITSTSMGGITSASSGGAFSSGGLGSTVFGGGGIGGQTNTAATGGIDSGMTDTRATMWTDGRLLRDACGNVIVLRGVQQILADQIPEGNDWIGLIDEIAATGANAIRIQANTTTLGIPGVDAVLARLASHRMVAILNPDDGTWFADAEVIGMLVKHQDHLILDAYGPGYDDRAKFLSSATAAVARLRGYGYQVPLIILSNNFGRDLPAALDLGAQIVEADPLHNTILGWDAYWGSSGWYQKLYAMSLTEGIAASAVAAFPVQVGLTLITDPPSEYLDYKTIMAATQANGLGWLWWDWYNPSGRDNNLSADGTSTNLLSVGDYVVHTQTIGIAAAATLTCTRP